MLRLEEVTQLDEKCTSQVLHLAVQPILSDRILYG